MSEVAKETKLQTRNANNILALSITNKSLETRNKCLLPKYHHSKPCAAGRTWWEINGCHATLHNMWLLLQSSERWSVILLMTSNDLEYVKYERLCEVRHSHRILAEYGMAKLSSEQNNLHESKILAISMQSDNVSHLFEVSPVPRKWLGASHRHQCAVI